MKTIKNIILIGFMGLLGLTGGAVQAQCDAPTHILLRGVTGSTATVEWVYSGTASGFAVELIDTATSMVVDTYNAGGAERTHTFTGLSERTVYRVAVAASCSGADTLAFVFSTSCDEGGATAVGNYRADNSYSLSSASTSNLVVARTQRGNSLSQQIYHAADLDGVSVITGIRFYMGGWANSTTVDRQWDVYVDTTSVDWFGSKDDYIPQDSAHMRFSGTAGLAYLKNASSYYNGMWSVSYVDILFDAPYQLPAGKNLLVTVNDHTGATGSSVLFFSHATAGNATIYGARNGATAAFDAAAATPFAGIAASNSGANALQADVLFLTPCGSLACQAPGIASVENNSAANAATLRWRANGGTGWNVKWREADSLAWTEAATDVADTFYTVTGLTPATDYLFRVVNGCDPSAGASTRYAMPCAAAGLPFFEDFEAATTTSGAASVFACWYSDHFNGLSTTNPSNHINMRGQRACGYLNSNDNYVLPPLAAPADGLAVSFDLLTNNLHNATEAGAQLYVGVCTDPTDESTYTVVDSVALFRFAPRALQRHTVWLDSYDGADGRIFFRVNGFYNSSIDNVAVDLAPACRSDIRASHVGEVTATTARLSWEDRYSPAGYTLLWGTTDTLSAATDSLTVAGTSALLSGLQAGTEYHVWVRANCGSDGTYVGELPLPVTLRTATAVAVSDENPWQESFEDADIWWQVSDSSNHAGWGAKTTSNGGYGYDGVRSLQMRSPLYDTGSALLVLPTFDFSGLGDTAELSFWHYQFAAWSEPMEVVYRTDTVGAWSHVAWIDTASSGEWVHRRVMLPASAGAVRYQVGLRGSAKNNGAGPCIDKVRVGLAAACRQPEGVSVSATDRSATVRWTGNAPAYKVEFHEAGSWQWDAYTVEGADSLVIAPLQHSTDYEVRVTGLCSALEQTDPSATVAFTTPFCEHNLTAANYSTVDTVSYTNFITAHKYQSYVEVLVDSAELAGLTTIEALRFHAAYVADVENPTGSVVLYMGHTTADTLSASQFLYPTLADRICVGSNSHGNIPHVSDTGWCTIIFSTPFVWDGHSNVVLGINKENNNFGADTMGVSSHVADRNKVSYGSRNSATAMNMSSINSITNWTERGAGNVVPNLEFLGCEAICYEPVVRSLNATSNKVVVSWYNEGDPVQVELKEAGEEWGDAPFSVSGASRTFSGLTENTAYDVRLRRVCDAINGDYSDWVECHISTTPGCHTPGGLAATAVGATTATLSWEGAGTGYEVRVWNGDGVDLYYEAAASPFTADGLRPNASYRAAVRTVCAGNEKSDWSQPLQFDNVCHPATDLTATSHDGNVYLSWTAGEHNQQWIVTWGYAGDERNQRVGFMETDTTAATITGLLPEVSYGFRVVAVCGDGWQGGWTGAEVTATVSTEGIDAVDGSTVYLYPNPATKRVTVGGLEGENTVTVVDMNGRECGKWKAESGEFSIDLSGYARGAYFVRITGERATTVRKLVVK